MTTILETERLILRNIQIHDLDVLYELLFADLEVKSTWSGRTGTAEEIKSSFAEEHISVAQSEFGLKAVVLKSENTFIGLMGFQTHTADEDAYYLRSEDEPQRKVGLDPNFIEAELTYAMGRPYWKHGYASEMGSAMVAYGFERLGIGQIIQGVLAHNANSINLMKRLGFRLEKGISGNVVGVLDNPTERR